MLLNCNFSKKFKISILLFIFLMFIYVMLGSTHETIKLYHFKLVSDSDATTLLDIICSQSLDGILFHNVHKNYFYFKFEENTVNLCSHNINNGRGMELSELINYNGRLLTVDDKTGIVYEVKNNDVNFWIKLRDGDGHNLSSFKGEWATIKDDQIYIGAIGKPYTNEQGKILHYNPLWIKIVDKYGNVTNKYWGRQYGALLKSLNIEDPGYVAHEAVLWCELRRKWFFFPRYVSNLTYSKMSEAIAGANVILISNDEFTDIKIVKVGQKNQSRGFSSVRFIPNTRNTLFLGLKSLEYQEKQETYVLVFDIHGNVIYPETKIANLKYEGMDFI